MMLQAPVFLDNGFFDPLGSMSIAKRNQQMVPALNIDDLDFLMAESNVSEQELFPATPANTEALTPNSADLLTPLLCDPLAAGLFDLQSLSLASPINMNVNASSPLQLGPNPGLQFNPLPADPLQSAQPNPLLAKPNEPLTFFTQDPLVIPLSPDSPTSSVLQLSPTTSSRPSESNALVCPHPGCTKSFNRFQNLKSHFRTHMKMFKPHSCSYCNMRFLRRHDLKRHTRLHTGELPYKCKTCDASWSRIEPLRKHELKGCPAVMGSPSSSSSGDELELLLSASERSEHSLDASEAGQSHDGCLSNCSGSEKSESPVEPATTIQETQATIKSIPVFNLDEELLAFDF